MKQVVRQIRERIKVELQLNNIKYELWRLDDAEYRRLQANSDDEESYQEAIQRFSSVGLNAFEPQNINSLLQTIISQGTQN